MSSSLIIELGRRQFSAQRAAWIMWRRRIASIEFAASLNPTNHPTPPMSPFNIPNIYELKEGGMAPFLKFEYISSFLPFNSTLVCIPSTYELQISSVPSKSEVDDISGVQLD